MKKLRKGNKTSIKADVIVLGSSLPGMVTANKLKKKFGNTMDIVVLELPSAAKTVQSKCNVAFSENISLENSSSESIDSTLSYKKAYDSPGKEQFSSSAKHFLIKFGNDLKVPLPDCIINPLEQKTSLKKIFQFREGKYVPCKTHYNDFDYLNFIEKFELKQYQLFLDQRMHQLFQSRMFDNLEERDKMLYYDQTSMEKNICESLLLPTSREIMRVTVQLVCGAPAIKVSLLFYLHQCYRTSGTKHHVGGQNIRHREKLLGYCRKRISIQLLESVADITLPAKTIKNIRMHMDSDVEQVILETLRGETTYICNSLAMALRPDQLQKIEVDHHLVPEKVANMIKGLTQGKTKKFIIQYEENFWERSGYSGDIFSLRGPIIWAMSRPQLSFTGSVDKYAALVGYLMMEEDENIDDSRDAVVNQLMNIFGPAAETPVTYKETSIADVAIPRCGDYVSLRVLTSDVSPKGVEWSAFDVFGEGDVAAALEAGQAAYLHLLSCLRPQAQTYEDISMNDWITIIDDSPFKWWLAQFNLIRSIKLTMCVTALIIGIKLIRSYLKN